MGWFEASSGQANKEIGRDAAMAEGWIDGDELNLGGWRGWEFEFGKCWSDEYSE